MEKTWTREELEAAYSETCHRAEAAANRRRPPWANGADWRDRSEAYKRATYFSWKNAQMRIQKRIFDEFYTSEVGQALALAEDLPEWWTGTLDKIQVPT
jgi:hypothetical protein